MNNFTKGEWRVVHNELEDCLEMKCSGFYDADIGQTIMSNEHYYPWNSENEADWHAQAAAMNAMTKLAEAGYDAIKVMELLPQLVELLDDRIMNVEKSIELWDWIEQCRVDCEEGE